MNGNQLFYTLTTEQCTLFYGFSMGTPIMEPYSVHEPS